MRQQPLTHQSLYKCVRTVKIRDLPRRAIQPERFIARDRQVCVSSIREISWKQMRHKRAKFEHNAKKLAVLRGRCNSCFRLWPAQRDHCLTLVSGHDDLGMARGK